MPNYLLSIPQGDTQSDGTIHDPKNNLKVKVCDILRSTFSPSNGEKRFFVTAGNEKLAFETKGYKRHRELHILQMIAWYCMYLGLMEAQIHTSLPL